MLWQDVFPQIKLWEFFQVDVASALQEFRTHLQNGAYPSPAGPSFSPKGHVGFYVFYISAAQLTPH